MVNHLVKSHGISTMQEGRDLADTWRISIEKQAWSCGFCGTFFLNFQDRLKHIDLEHFKKYQSIQDWDFNKVIHGLLLQPKMEKAWKKRSASLLPWMQPKDLVWTQAFAKDMQKKLEIGPLDESDANGLANVVCCAGIPKEAWYGNDMILAHVGGGMTGGSSLSPSKQDPALPQASGSTQEHRRGPSTLHATAYPSGESLFGQPPRLDFGHDSSAVPLTMSSHQENQMHYDASSFCPSQDWAATSETGNDYSVFNQAANEANQGLF